MIDKLYDINKKLDSLKDISYYCELGEGHCSECTKEHWRLSERLLELKEFRAENKKENVYT